MVLDQPNGKFNSFLKATAPLVFFAAGLYVVITGRTHLGSGPEDGPPLDRASATALGLANIGAGLVLYIQLFWSRSPVEQTWTKLVKLAGAMTFLLGLVFLAIHTGLLDKWR